MSLVTYPLEKGSGPSLSRLADSWLYNYEPLTDVVVTFHFTDSLGESIALKGRVEELRHASRNHVRVRMTVCNDSRHGAGRVPYNGRYADITYNHKLRIGELSFDPS
ncbi:MAG: hypothetical protein JWO07_557 [Candidatus Saccharibacteria bacterium]|nr:hypothetical protein [Candidatus Saccharibacteria bacterium]